MNELGTDGNRAPDRVDGLPFLKWLGITTRLATLRSWDVMNPNYGLDLRPDVDRRATDSDLESAAQDAVSDIAPEARARVTTDSAGNRRVQVEVAQ